MEKEIRLHGYTVHLESPGKTVIELTPEELARQLKKQGLEVLVHSNKEKIAIILENTPNTCQCKEPNLAFVPNETVCHRCGKPIAGKKIEPLDEIEPINGSEYITGFVRENRRKINEIIKKMEG